MLRVLSHDDIGAGYASEASLAEYPCQFGEFALRALQCVLADVVGDMEGVACKTVRPQGIRIVEPLHGGLEDLQVLITDTKVEV